MARSCDPVLEFLNGVHIYIEKQFLQEKIKSQAFFMANILACHCRKSTGVTNNTNDGCVLFTCPYKL